MNSPFTGPWDQPFAPVFDMATVQGVVAISGLGVTVTPGRALAVICTGAGNVAMQFPDGSSITVPVAVGYSAFQFAVVQVLAAGTTATATYYNLR